MKIAKLFDDDGSESENPTPFDGSVYWDAKEAIAQAFGPDGKQILCEMHNARIVRITHRGIQIEGFEPVAQSRKQFRPMAWFVTY
jgi:hypothetical protein